MRETNRFNDTANYSNRAFDFGFRADHLPERPVYAAYDGEEVILTVLPYDGKSVETVKASCDAVDFAMIEELGRSKYLSSLQIYQYVGLRGYAVNRRNIRSRLNRMMNLRVIREYELKTPEEAHGLKVYDLDYKGFRIAEDRGVLFHKGNLYLSNTKKRERDQFDTAADIKRVVVGNMIVLSALMNGARLERFGIMETMRPSQKTPIVGKGILRTAANVQLDQDSVLLYEAVRSTPHAMRKLADKVDRYYTLIHDPGYLEDNYYGFQAVPQLVLCGESYEHCVKIDQYLRSRDLIHETDSLLYTEDLFYVRQGLQNLYELDAEGRRTWYCLPSEQPSADVERSA